MPLEKKEFLLLKKPKDKDLLLKPLMFSSKLVNGIDSKLYSPMLIYKFGYNKET